MASTKFTPLHDRILVRRVEEGESIRGGIIIPDSAKEKPQQGEVISVGKGKSNDEGKVFPLDVKAGDTILFGKYSGTEIKLDGEEFLIMREEEVLGIVKKYVLPREQRLRATSPSEGTGKRHQLPTWQPATDNVAGDTQWQNKFCMEKIPARQFCAESTFWPMR